jgi:hypothetical protein
MDEETTDSSGEHEPASDAAAVELDFADLDGSEMAELLDRIPGARDRIKRGIEDAREGRTIPLDDF